MKNANRIPGGRWWISQGRRLRQSAAADHAAAVADHHHHLSGPLPATHPEYGSTGELPSGTTASARIHSHIRR